MTDIFDLMEYCLTHLWVCLAFVAILVIFVIGILLFENWLLKRQRRKEWRKKMQDTNRRMFKTSEKL